MTPPTWAQMVRVFGRIGVLSFGGPAAQIALMQSELIDRRGWLDQATFLRALSLCMMLPGPEAMQLATYAGWRLRGIPGGILAGALFVLPGAAVIAVLVALYAQWGDMPAIRAAFLGIKAAVIVIVIQALRKIGAKALGSVQGVALAGCAFAAIFLIDAPFPLIVAAAACFGYAFGMPGQPGAAAPPALSATGGAIAWRTAAIWTALWLAPLFALSLGNHQLLAELGWFFARLAVVTFGGAYAVLAYMTQTVALDHGWISTEQMIDALGMAETTPGPLILVTQFVAMLSGHIAGGPGLALAAGAVALWATFVPCFLWIFVAAPHLDRIAGWPRLESALQAVTAAVVGVILNLSVIFALHLLFTQVAFAGAGPWRWPVVAGFVPQAALLTGLAAVLLLWLRLGLGISLMVMAGAGLVLGMV
ncbi:MAG: chromate efflux transporter [Rhodobacteraceae bacterium]|nr:chromate efflux transporter [Paracoccaceae bacterium]